MTMICERPTRRYPEGRTGTPPGMRAHQRIKEPPCDACRQGVARYLKAYGTKNRDRIAAYNRERRDKRQEVLDRLKAVPCADCGGTFPSICMDFDHVRGRKLFFVSRAGTRSLDLVLREIAKCDVVCANCHRIRTAARLVRKHPKVATAR